MVTAHFPRGRRGCTLSRSDALGSPRAYGAPQPSPARPFLSLVTARRPLVGFGVYLLGRMFAAQDRSGLFAGLVTAVGVIGLGVGTSLLVGWSLRGLAEGRAARVWAARGALVDRGLLLVAGLGVAAAVPWLWNARPLFHGLLMPLYQWPLVTWIPLVLGLLFTAACVLVSVGSRHGAASGLRAGIVWRVPFTVRSGSPSW